MDGSIVYVPVKAEPQPERSEGELRSRGAPGRKDGNARCLGDSLGFILLRSYLSRRSLSTTIYDLRARFDRRRPSPDRLQRFGMAKTDKLHAVQKALGHSQVSLTANLYSHASLEGSKQISDAMGDVIKKREYHSN